MKDRICVVAAGHLTHCPRMLKAADAFAEAGYRVRVVSSQHIPWATTGDEDIKRARNKTWQWTIVNWNRNHARSINLWSALRFRFAKKIAKLLEPANCPLKLAGAAYIRINHELTRAALSESFDLIYGGGGALAAVAIAGRLAGAPYALDMEDFHSAEQEEETPSAQLSHALAERIEREVLPDAAFLTTASEAMASAYTKKYGVRPTPINNTFPLPKKIPVFTPSLCDGLKLYWFSQTIGAHRGLEDVICAMGIAEIPGELHLRGQAIPGYLERLKCLAADVATQLQIIHHEPASPDEMVRLCYGYDVGLALEQTHIFNRNICLTNKAFTYMLAGLAVAFTDTQGQRNLAADLKDGAIIYTPGDVDALAAGLRRWADDKKLLELAKAAAWHAAKQRWHWEHPQERGVLLSLAANVLGH